MELSVIIVNYNVPFFLEQCLASVERAMKNVHGEIIVIDNCSTDRSMPYLIPRFPGVRFVQNAQNLGFGKANNLGIQLSKGEYVLFLNPDTLVPEDCLRKCVDFMKSHPDAGGLGVRMIDGSGKFLKESKRGFPSPTTSLYKLCGLTSIFPQSPKYARYYLGHIPEFQTSEVDVLAGACMMVSRKVLEITGNFDPAFFMYGEDIDLSYRIQKAGYKNYYFPETTIVHFKGESTKKSSLNYVTMFYQAMSIFVNKHYPSKKSRFFRLMLKTAIWGRALISGLHRFILQVGMPVLDLVFLMLAFSLSLQIWENYVKTDTVYDRDHIIITYAISCLVVWMVHFCLGMYDKTFKISRTLKSFFLTGLGVLTIYSLLPEALRFSRGIVVLSTVFFYLMAWAYRKLFVVNGILLEEEDPDIRKPALVMGTGNEMYSAIEVIRKSGKNTQILGRITSDTLMDQGAVINVRDLKDRKKDIPFDELICCFGESSLRQALTMLALFPATVKIRYHMVGSSSIVGSDSKDQCGEALSSNSEYRLWRSEERRNKRLVDVCTSLFIFSTWFLLAWIIPHPFGLLRNSWQVLTGKKTWIGYAFSGYGLPDLAPGILATTARPKGVIPLIDKSILYELDHSYARSYHYLNDIKLIRNGIYWLGC